MNNRHKWADVARAFGVSIHAHARGATTEVEAENWGYYEMSAFAKIESTKRLRGGE